MKEILDILIKAPISKLAEIDPKLAGHVIKAAGLLVEHKCKPDAIYYTCDGERDILYYHSDLAYGQRRDLGWTHERMVNEGEAEWPDSNPAETRAAVVTCDYDTFKMIQKERWTNQQIVDAGYGHWENANE